MADTESVVSGQLRELQESECKCGLEFSPVLEIPGYWICPPEQERPLLNIVETLNSVAMEGNIGVGKSHGGRALRDQYPESVELCVEPTDEGMLGLFYSSPPRYAYAMQWGMLLTRLYQMKLAQLHRERLPIRKIFIWDRSTLGDYIFALYNYLRKSLDRAEMDVYEAKCGGKLSDLLSIKGVAELSAILLLDDEPKNCKERVEVLRQHPSEKDIPLWYYEGIDDIHFSVFIRLFELCPEKIITLRWGQYHTPEEIITAVANTKRGRVTQLQTLSVAQLIILSRTKSDKAIVFTSRRTVESFYERKLYPVAESIYIPRNIMTVSAEDKGVQVDPAYNLTYYENAYKRVVMAYLAQRSHVYFYTL